MFQYPLLGSIGCDVIPALRAVARQEFQYPLLGSIGCDRVSPVSASLTRVVSVSSPRIDWL